MKKNSVLALWLCLVFFQLESLGQTPVNVFSTVSNVVVAGGTSTQTITSHPNSVNTVSPSTNYTVNYNNNGNVNIVDFTISGKSYVRFSNFDTIILRRVANAWEPSNGNKQHIYYQGPLLIDNLFHNIPFPAAFPVVANHTYMERVMKEGYINRGSDNLFNNDATSDQTFNNIERVDFVIQGGIGTPSINSAGFLIAERGGNDPFKIAAITGVDVNGNPTSFGPVLSVGTGSYGNAMLSTTTVVMRKDPADNVLRPFSYVPIQSVKSVFIRFSDLGIAAFQTVYGYALMANDVTATTTAQLLNYTNNTYFPQNTTTVNGGMDLASAPGLFHTDLVLEGHSLTLAAQAKNGAQLLQWTDNDHAQVKEYQVERSFDRESFEKIGSVSTIYSANNSYTDRTVGSPCYYRIKVVPENGASYYSSIVFAKSSPAAAKVSFYPNPVKDVLTLTYDPSANIQLVSLFAVTGKEIAKWQVNENSQQLKLDISALPQGQYFIRLDDKNGAQKAYPVIKL